MRRLQLLPAAGEGRGWNLAIFAVEILLFVPAIWWIWYDHLPPSGWSVACIAIAAALMSIHDKMTSPQKTFWMLLMAWFLGHEFRSINKDRWDANEAQRIEAQAENDKFQRVLDQERADNKNLLDYAAKQFQGIVDQQKINFGQTMDSLQQTATADKSQFAGVLRKQEDLYEPEEQLAQSQTGNLQPANEPMPQNTCGLVTGEQFLVEMVNGNEQTLLLCLIFPRCSLRVQSMDQQYQSIVARIAL